MSRDPAALGMTTKAAVEARLGSLLTGEAVMRARRLTARELADYVQQGHIVQVTLPDSTVWYPSAQFSRKRDPRVVAIAIATFSAYDPTGVTAAAWLATTVSPQRFLWRDIDHYVTQDGGMHLVTVMACLDLARLKNTAP